MVYGSAADVKSKLTADGQTPTDDLITTALKSADTLINIELEKHGITPDPTSNAIKEAATYYATAEALQSLFNGSTEEPDGVDFYMERADRFLNGYVDKHLSEAEDNPYYVGQTHCSTRNKLDEIIL